MWHATVVEVVIVIDSLPLASCFGGSTFWLGDVRAGDALRARICSARRRRAEVSGLALDAAG